MNRLPLQGAKDDRSKHERQQQRGDRGGHGPERYVPEDIQYGVLLPKRQQEVV
jgi:hypothetical protein